MSAEQEDLFAPPPAEPDLRSVQAWPVTAGDARYGWWVRTSWCGRYTICGSSRSARLLAYRRNVVGDRWNLPTDIGSFVTLEAAMQACAAHAEGST